MIDLSDSILKFQVNDGERIIDCEIDLLMLTLTSEEMVEKHRLERRQQDGREVYWATADFLMDLAKKITPLLKTSQPLEVSPTLAKLLWVKSGDLMAREKKNTNVTPNSPSGMESAPSDLATNNEPGCC